LIGSSSTDFAAWELSIAWLCSASFVRNIQPIDINDANAAPIVPRPVKRRIILPANSFVKLLPASHPKRALPSTINWQFMQQ
jgi:hypothetical protein